ISQIIEHLEQRGVINHRRLDANKNRARRRYPAARDRRRNSLHERISVVPETAPKSWKWPQRAPIRKFQHRKDWLMSTIVEILQSTEEVLLPDGSRMLAQVAEREEALMQASLRESTLWREREHQRLQMQRVALAGNRSNSGGYSDARSGG